MTFSVFGLTNQAHAETEISGNITSDTTWTSVNSPYNILDTLQVFNGATLTIQEGVEVKTAKSKIIKIAGALIVNGTNINPVIFSSFGIDKWQGIEFIDSNNSQINNSIIENAGVAIDLKGISEVSMTSNIFRNNTRVITDTHGYQRMYFVNNTVYDNGDVFYGIRTSGNNNVFRNNTFRNNSSVFHHGYYTDNTTIDNNNFINNVFVIRGPEQGFGYGIVSIVNNWWNTTDTNLIDNLINDKNDDVALQLLDYLPNKTSEVEGIGSSISLAISASQNTCTSWTYSNWSLCSSNGQQTRSIISSSPNNCSGGNPALTQSCTYTPPTCTSWEYSIWSACSNNEQSRTVTASQPASCMGGTPVLTQSCDSTPLCKESNWASTLTPTVCPSNGQQTKKWTKIGECKNGTAHQAEEIAGCDYAPSCNSDTWVCEDWGGCLSNGSQVRTCTKTFDCPSIQTPSPVIKQFCEIQKDTSQQTTNNSVEVLNRESNKVVNGNLSVPSIKNYKQKATPENKMTDLQVVEQRKSEVADAVQEILQITEKDSEIGQKIKIITQTQTQNQEKLETSLQKVQNRGGLTKFFVGPDYGEINNTKKLLEKNREQVKQLDEVQNQLTNKSAKQKLTEQVQLLEQTNQEIENSLNTPQKGFSLFGWIFRLFVK